jgi:hypothetical protein
MRAFQQLPDGSYRLVLVIAARHIPTAERADWLRTAWEAAFAEQNMEIEWC